MEAAGRHAEPRLRQALHGTRAAGRARLRLRLPAQSLKAVVALACICLLQGCTTLASKPAVVGCQGADTATTLHGMERGARELNPIVAAIFNTLGPAGFIAAKAGVTLLVLHYHAEISTGLLATANVVTCGAAAHNVAVATKLPPKNSGTEP